MGGIKACIFDLDGVIVDTARYHYLAWKRLAHELGYNLTEKDNEQLKGVSRMASLDIVLNLANVSLSEEHKQILADKKNNWFNEYIERMGADEIYPGVKTLIRDFREGALKVGLASSSKNAAKVIKLLGITHEFDAIVDGTMICHTKPDPEIFLKAAEKLGIAPESCVVIEDAEAGVDAALAAGMKCIGIGSPTRLGHAHKVVSNTADISFSTLKEL